MNAVYQDMSAAVSRELDQVTRQYGFSSKAVVSPLSESENKIYLVSDPECEHKYVIRVNSGRLAYHTRACIESELQWMMALYQDTDIEVPEVAAATDGSIVQRINFSSDGAQRFAAVYSFLPGAEPSEENLNTGFKRLGRLTAKMHIHVRDWMAPTSFERPLLTPANILEDKLNWGPWQAGEDIDASRHDLLCRVEDRIREDLATVPEDKDHFGLIHADLRLANLLVDGDRTAIIDFDDCGFGWYFYDLAAALSFLEERDDVPDLISEWVAGYSDVIKPSAVLLDKIPAFVMLRRLQLLGWVGYQRHLIPFARDISKQFSADTCKLAEKYLEGRAFCGTA